MKNKIRFIMVFAVVSILFTACGKDKTLSKYQEAMTTFSESIAQIDEEMNAIDPSSEQAVADLLVCLDSMNEEFSKLADLEVPEHFASIETLADEAGEYMTQAVDLYKQVFSTTPYDEYSSVLADESYKRAMKRVQYIGEILQGRTPEGEDITIYEDGQEPTAEPETGESVTDNPQDYEVPVEDLLEE